MAQGEGVLDAQGVARIATKAPVVPDDGFLTLRVTATAPDRTVSINEGKKANAYKPELFEGVTLRLGWLRVNGELLP